nr:hypothetical protein [uncultured Sulfurimonas sp.]
MNFIIMLGISIIDPIRIIIIAIISILLKNNKYSMIVASVLSTVIYEFLLQNIDTVQTTYFSLRTLRGLLAGFVIAFIVDITIKKYYKRKKKSIIE